MRLQAPRIGSPLGVAALAVVLAAAVLAISRSDLASQHIWAEGPAPALLPATTPLGGSFPVRYLPGAAEGPSIRAAAAILMEASTGTILFAKNEHQRRAPASTTKIVTALLAIESGTLQDLVQVSRRAASVVGSSADLVAGERYTLEELLYGLMLPSGNDAAVAIAEHLDGSVEAFARRMNRRARELGAYGSHFVNPHGLDDPNHYSTAYDLALFARTALQFPLFARIVGTRAFSSLTHGTTWHNTNRLLWSFDGATGVKTGTTGRAGNCLVAAASRDGTTLVSVVLDSADRWADSARLLEYGFEAFARVELARRDEEVATAAVAGGRPAELRVLAGETLATVVPIRQVKDVRGRVELDPLQAPITAGARVGRLVAYVGEQAVAHVPLIAAHAVARRLWWWPWR
ncbi:MAG TPA: D-alanyl-D-alanine carboxypeptidase family protein [Limnochordales bacterium]